MDFNHVSVLYQQSLEGLNIRENGTYVDATLGGGGHTYGICQGIKGTGKVIGIDQDINAIKAAEKRLKNYRACLQVVNDNFKNIKFILQELEIKSIDGAIMDLGVSSYQLDTPMRGFSYQHDAPLDMRMDVKNTIDAFSIVNTYSSQALSEIIRDYGEEKWAKRIADYIVQARAVKQIDTTGELVEIIKKAIPAAARREGPHPAKRTFQAIRIAVNDELGILEKAISDFVDALEKEGRMSIITFHSLEDRIVKRIFAKLSKACTCPPKFPVCICNKKAKVKLITRKPVQPTMQEMENNPRARSAKLRIIEKL